MALRSHHQSGRTRIALATAFALLVQPIAPMTARAQAPAAKPAAAQPAAAAPAAPPVDPGMIRVEAPMVGTFYRSSSPGTPPFVQEGDAVGAGQTLCILEAMKLMNEVKADIEGIVRAVHVDDAQPVEFGQLLFELEPVDAQPIV